MIANTIVSLFTLTAVCSEGLLPNDAIVAGRRVLVTSKCVKVRALARITRRGEGF